MEIVKKALADFGLLKPNIIELAIPGSNEKAFAIEVDVNTKYELWEHLRGLKAELGMYPVISATWGGMSSSWAESVKGEDVFSRFYYSEESPGEDTSPLNIITKSKGTIHESILEEHNKIYSEEIVDSISYYIDGLKLSFGKAPFEQEVLDQMARGEIKDYFSLNKWFFDWSIKEIGLEKLSMESTEFLNWYEPSGQSELLILLPTSNSCEIIAYIHWFGACTTNTEKAISLLRKWNAKYGAEVVAHYGTMLHIKVAKKPETTEEAFELAKEHESFAPCTTALPGATLSDLAIALMSRDTWFLHERP